MQWFDGEELLGGAGEGGRIEGFEAMDDAMGGENDEAVGVHVDEGHHAGGLGERRLRQSGGAVLGLVRRGGGVLLGVVEGGFVAVMAVGDDELLVGHGGGQQADRGRVADAPEAVKNAVLVGDFGLGGAVAVVEDLLDASGGVGVEHEDLSEVGAGGFEEVEAVVFGLGEGLLVAEDDLLGVLVELAEGNKTSPLLHNFRSGNLETLRIGEDAGVLLLGEDALLAPGGEVACGAGIDAFALFRVKEFRQSEDDADQIVRAALVVSLLHGRGDLVVGLGDGVFEADRGGIVTPGAKWINAGHERGLAPGCGGWNLRAGNLAARRRA